MFTDVITGAVMRHHTDLGRLPLWAGLNKFPFNGSADIRKESRERTHHGYPVYWH
jgi:hypothetical protein